MLHALPPCCWWACDLPGFLGHPHERIIDSQEHLIDVAVDQIVANIAAEYVNCHAAKLVMQCCQPQLHTFTRMNGFSTSTTVLKRNLLFRQLKMPTLVVRAIRRLRRLSKNRKYARKAREKKANNKIKY